MADNRIGGGRPGNTPDLPAQQPEDAQAPAEGKGAKGAGRAAKGQKAADASTTSAGSVDQFERSARVGAQIETRLQGLGAKATTGPKIQFSNEDIAQLASIFASIVSQNGEADRLKRARMFARAILRQKRLRKVFAGVSEAEMEQMCDVIGDVLDSSPVFGQLVEDVTEGAGKLTSG